MFMMMVHLDNTNPKYKISRMICRDRVKLRLEEDGIDDSIDTQMTKHPHNLFVFLAALDYERSPDTGTLRK